MADENQGVGTEQPAAPSEPAQITTDASADVVVNSEQPADKVAETVVASEPAPTEETEWIEGNEFGDDQTRIAYDKKLGRKYFMQVQQMGGDAVFDATREIASDLVSASADPIRLAHKINALNPEAYQQLGSVLLDQTLRDRFGRDVTWEQVEQALRRPAETKEPQPNEDEPDPYVDPAIQAQLDELKELKRKFPELETEVGQFKELREQQKQEKIQQFGQTIVTEAMSPLGKLYEDAGLKILPGDTPEEKEWKQYVAETVYEQTYKRVYENPNNKAFVDETQAGIESMNELIARKHMLKLQARAEAEASKLLKLLTGKRTQARNLQTEQLNKETPKFVPGGSGAAAFAQTSDTSPAFDPDRANQVFQDIVGRQ